MKKKNIVPGTIAIIKSWDEIANNPHGATRFEVDSYNDADREHRSFKRSGGCTWWRREDRLSGLRVVICEPDGTWNTGDNPDMVTIKREDGDIFWGDYKEVHVDRAVLKALPKWRPVTCAEDVPVGTTVRYNPAGGGSPHFHTRVKGVVFDHMYGAPLVQFGETQKCCLFKYLEVRA